MRGKGSGSTNPDRWVAYTDDVIRLEERAVSNGKQLAKLLPILLQTVALQSQRIRGVRKQSLLRCCRSLSQPAPFAASNFDSQCCMFSSSSSSSAFARSSPFIMRPRVKL